MYIPIFTHPAAQHCVSLCARVCVLYVRSVGYSGRKPLRSEENCWAIVRVTRLVVRGEKGGGEGRGKGGGGVEGRDQKVLKEIESYKAREISLCQKLAVMLLLFHSLPPHLPVSVPSVTNYC